MLKALKSHPRIEFQGFGPSTDEIANEFVKGRYVKDFLEASKAPERQMQIARQSGVASRTNPVLGQATMSIDPYVYWYWRKRERAGVWGDKSHKRYFKRYFPETQIKTEKNMSKVGWVSESKKGFSKNYGEI